MPAPCAVFSLSSAAAFVGIDARITVNALFPGGQPDGAGAGVVVAGGAGVAAGVAAAGAGVVVEAVGAGVGAGVVAGVSAGAAWGAGAAGWVGVAAVVLPASL